MPTWLGAIFLMALLEKMLQRFRGTASKPASIRQSVPHIFESRPEFSAQFDGVWTDYNARHGEPSDPVRILQMMFLLGVAKEAAGDYLELGTHKGLTARVIYRTMEQDRTLTLLDTFKGFVEKDLVREREIYSNDWHEGNFEPTSPALVRDYVTAGTPGEKLRIVKGWFPAAYEGLEDKTWCFVHIDFDLYDPIRSALNIVWPQVSPGGVVIVHDYGCFGFPGAKKAVDEFSAEIGIVPTPMCDRWGSAVFIKPRTAVGH